MSSEGRGRIARWARRKAAVKQRGGGAAPVVPDDAANVPARDAAPPEGAPTEPKNVGQPADEPDLPDIETLTADSDFTPFMKDGVPGGLRRLALRKLWASDPMFNVIDEMVEYGEDYTDAATVVAGMKSAWEAGRGYVGKAEDKDGDDDKIGDEANDEVASDGAQRREAETSADAGTASDGKQTTGNTDERG